ncbi:MAG TPA: DUF4097 family beta strand repeat-containing protein [Candidatus Angelobacter sp.]|jgi:DUF4097 and DUF4098 domain-containing protein YvlB|nr:DUF4097 family beta strand repeat-containing protein [Candidatus Angelobacter sp.]
MFNSAVSGSISGAFMENMQRTTVLALVLATCLASEAVAQSRREFRYTVRPTAKANISVDTQYGSITVRPGYGNQVVIIAVQESKADIDHLQKGNRIEIESQLMPGADAQSGRVDYELTVPANATVSLRSSKGPLTIERLRGDLTLEGADAPIEIRNSGGGHVHITTMKGAITLTDVTNAHIEITSISGDIRMNSVNGPFVQVKSGSGKISYDGDFGSDGDYTFTTHTGDIEALVASSASADFNARSVHGQVQSELPLIPNEKPKFPVNANSFAGTVGKASSEVLFTSISGKIRLKKR